MLCATGAVSLRGEDFPHLRNGAYVATVTSSEDELELDGLPDVYTRTTIGDHVARYQTTGHYFYLANGGNAVNFLHGASVGPFIFLVQAEILAAIRMLARGDLDPGMHEVNASRPSRHRGDLARLLQPVDHSADHGQPTSATTLDAYLDEHPEEKAGLAPILDLLDAGADLDAREEFRGHARPGDPRRTPTGASSTSTTAP